MSSAIVVGLCFGDEGKARVVDYLAKDFDVGCRWNGGPNAGHTIIVGQQKYVTHLLPATVLYSNKLSIIGPGVAIDLAVLERDLIETGAGSLGNNVIIDKNCPMIEQKHKDADTGDNPLSKKIGTTGRGVGPCFADQARRSGTRYKDLVDEPAQADTSAIIHHAMKRGKSVLFEGAQGTLLDNIHGTYPFVTSCSTLAGSVYSSMGVNPSYISDVYGVFKAYTTRVGNGPFPTELSHQPLTEKLRMAGGEYGATTGRPRRIGWLDLVELKRACQLNNVTKLVMTKADVLSGMPAFFVCEAYEEGFPAYAEVPGWSGDISNIRHYAGFPYNLRKYIARIEDFTGVPIVLISTGPERQQICRGA